MSGFPEFSEGRLRLLFFSRGRGRGHAVPDIEILQEFESIRPDAEVRLVSYASGADALSEAGLPLIDLDMPESGPLAELSVAAGRLIRWLDPDVIVSHEEFCVPPAAKIFGKPCLFITDFFAEPDLYSMRALQFADEILFTGREGVFDEPEYLTGKVRYLGPAVRRLHAQDTVRSGEQFVIGVLPGSWTQQAAAFEELVVSAFDGLEHPSKKLVWVAGPRYDDVRRKTAGYDNVHVHRTVTHIGALMAGCDVAFTRGSRMSTLELASLRVPVIAVSYGLNKIDDRALAGLPGVSFVDGATLRPSQLAQALLEAEEPAQAIAFRHFAECAARIGAHFPPPQSVRSDSVRP